MTCGAFVEGGRRQGLDNSFQSHSGSQSFAILVHQEGLYVEQNAQHCVAFAS